MPILNRGAANPALDWFMPKVTNLHHEKTFVALAVIVCAILVWRGGRRTRIAVLCALLAVGLSDLTAMRVVKSLAPRDRPCFVAAGQTAYSFPDDRLIGRKECPGSPSFPSNHAANMMSLAVVGWWFTRGRARWLWFLLPLVIGYSRIYLGFHYPTDVLGGWILGAGVAALFIMFFRRLDSTPSPLTTTETS